MTPTSPSPFGAYRALTIKQPWLDAILYGTKRTENRTWSRKVDHGTSLGWIWLHASAAWDKEGERWMGAQQLHTPTLGAPRSALLGLAFVHTISNNVDKKRDPWAFGPWCWGLSAVVPLLDPVPCKGALGLWTVPAPTLALALGELLALPLDLAQLDEQIYKWPPTPTEETP